MQNNSIDPAVRISDSPEFRRVRAKLGGHALHEQHPDVAKKAGRKGGQVTSSRYKDGRRAWGVAMAMKRWHKTASSYRVSRAPGAGPTRSKSGPAPALIEPRWHQKRVRTAKTNSQDQSQLNLF